MHPNLEAAYQTAVENGHTGESAAHKAWILTYRITTNHGAFRSREQVVTTVAARLRKCRVNDAVIVAARFIDDHDFMRRHAGETAGSIAREVADAVMGDWYTAPFSRGRIKETP